MRRVVSPGGEGDVRVASRVPRAGIARPYVVESHRITCFSDADYRGAMEAAGLVVTHDPEGFGRGLWIGRKP
jgi:hypothetical protein